MKTIGTLWKNFGKILIRQDKLIKKDIFILKVIMKLKIKNLLKILKNYYKIKKLIIID